eukprot:TRINITY_DN4549_c1_g1_i1.p1 TRINITY_DN4549_c1_g1~~TRINITY_DN4549_c1_g1_i1.p1  ORF type:complete len:650 (+),score=287.03 TRINITY_DN4549_c1_g1_i1:126-2075(+)
MHALKQAFGLGRRKLAYDVSPDILNACRDTSKYLVTANDLQYLHSEDGLRMRGGMCRDISGELLRMIREANDPIKALDCVDTMSNVMCLILDPAEATRRTHPDAGYRQAADDAFAEVFHYMSELNTSTELYDVLVALLEPSVWDTLTAEQKTTTLIMKKDMDSNGIHLPEEQRAQIVGLNTQNAQLAHDLLTVTSEHQQRMVLDKLLDTRRQLAELSGFKSYADWAVQHTLVGSTEKAWAFLNELSSTLQPKAAKEFELLHGVTQRILKESKGSIPLTQVDVAAKQVYTMNHYGKSFSQLREYLSVANIWRGLQLICDKLFGIRLEHQSDLHAFERYHPSVQKYNIFDKDGSFIGTIYADLLERPDKMENAAHYTVQLGATLHQDVTRGLGLDGDVQRPIVIFSCSGQGGASAGGDWEKVLVTPSEMVTLFHEFGHALHTVFGQTSYQNVAGTRSSLDYVEAFSQFFEYLARDYRVIKEFAFHHKTGEPVPEDLVRMFNEANTSLSASEKLDQIVLSTIDLAAHGPIPMVYRGLAGERKFCSELTHLYPALRRVHFPMSQEVEPTLCFSMSHLSNYPAAYYSYSYSKIIAAAIWSKYFLDDPLNAASGAALRGIMAQGAAAPPSEMLLSLFPEGADATQLLKDIPEDVL